MADTGWLICGTGSEVTEAGAAWTNATNITADDANTADYEGSSPSRGLKATNFGFAVPAGSTINGIDARVHNALVGTCTQILVSIVKAGTTGSENKGSGNWTNGGTDSFGGVADLWSESWTVADINDSGTGLVIKTDGDVGPFNQTHNVNFIDMRVTYTAGAAGAVIQRRRIEGHA